MNTLTFRVEKTQIKKELIKFSLAIATTLVALFISTYLFTSGNVIMIFKNYLGWNIPTWIAASLAAISAVGKLNSACAILLGVTVPGVVAGLIAAAGTAAA